MVESLIHRRAVGIDYAVQRWRAERARKAGYITEVIPYTSYGSTSWLRILARVVLAKNSQRQTDLPTGIRGWRNFVGVPVENARVSVDTEAGSHEVQADHSGIIDVVIDVDLEPGWHQIGLSSDGSDIATALVFIVDPQTTFGVVSDVDDTVMVTALPRPLLAAWHTFVVNEHARATTPGMPVLYERLSTRYPGAPFIYLSTGAWNVAPTLTRFLSRNLYPAGPLLLTDWGPTADSWFRSGRQHKRSSLERLAREFPEIKWLLIGDDGQHDESIYGDFVAQHRDNVNAICIRQLTPSEAVFAGSSFRGHTKTGDSTVPWLYALDGAGMADKLERIGLLEPAPQQPEIEA
ncbi:MAG TPA: phosphatase domain-containing protein [Propionibacteriaceae bacterium]|nr:phosphatase domain-containing protein [Propionibacteriaceae bacterium]